VAEPFLRWAGGKRWLASRLAPLLRERLMGRFIEPFLGSGAVFFALGPTSAILSDLNDDLINAFRAVEQRPQELLNAISGLKVDPETYYFIRQHEPSDPCGRAVRFIYLNRTCYGGLYRENKEGRFNVPYGGGSRTPKPLWERSLIKNAHGILASCDIDLRKCDFGEVLEEAREGDVVYCDPAYRGAARDRFDRYGKVVFGWHDHARLASAAWLASRRGALVLIRNASRDQIINLYPCGLAIPLYRSRSIGNKSKDPERQREVLIVLDPERSQRWRQLELAPSLMPAPQESDLLAPRLSGDVECHGGEARTRVASKLAPGAYTARLSPGE
jgi:DNA adenine methylase